MYKPDLSSVYVVLQHFWIKICASRKLESYHTLNVKKNHSLKVNSIAAHFYLVQKFFVNLMGKVTSLSKYDPFKLKTKAT